MSYSTTLEFVSRDCKMNNHMNCCGEWNGFGFKIICSCKHCHNNNNNENKNDENNNENDATTLVKDWEPNANVITETPFSPETQKK